MTQIRLAIDGMHCASCSALIERMVSRMNGVQQCNVNLAAENGTVVFDPNTVTIDAILTKISELGFSGSVIPQEKRSVFDAERRLKEEKTKKHNLIQLVVAVCLTALMMIIGMTGAGHSISHEIARLLGFGQGSPSHEDTMFVMNCILLVLCIPVEFWCGARFFKGALGALKNKAGSMDTLVAVGTGCAFLYALYVTFSPTMRGMMAPYETSAMLITFVLLGKTLEAHAKGKAGDALEELMDLAPQKANVVRGGVTLEIDLEDVIAGDVVIIKAGERVPVDGVILEGSSSIDESMITGEPMPVLKNAGDEVTGGTLNSSGVLKVRAQKVGSDTMLAQIIRLVEEAQGTKPPVQLLADRIASIFVPVVLSIALLAFLVWYFVLPALGITAPYEGHSVFEKALLVAISVVVVACPCALGLATPTAIMVGTGKGAELGILIKDPSVLETAGKIDVTVFDKTGTLTIGRPQIIDMKVREGITASEALIYAAALEQQSSHPLAQAIMAKVADIDAQRLESGEKRIELPQVKESIEEAGYGISGVIEDEQFFVGNKKLMQKTGVPDPDSFFDGDERNNHVYATTLAIGSQKRGILAVFYVADVLKETSPQGIDLLKEKQIEPFMLTGDTLTAAAALAEQAHIEYDHVIAQVLPAQKSDEIKKLKENGHAVAMVGDGINDAPALVTADVGIAMGNGTGAALEAGSIVLMNGDVRLVSRAIDLSRATMRKIHQNFGWALGYNCIMIPLAFCGILAPELSSACMALSSVSVVTNSLLLRRFGKNDS
ncbi:MAG: copper-translocating P-type ATPase [Coriobacteriales bacterium]|nr:copper-translocating P-type ATPase [Coriobacteriales bacterium]